MLAGASPHRALPAQFSRIGVAAAIGKLAGRARLQLSRVLGTELALGALACGLTLAGCDGGYGGYGAWAQQSSGTASYNGRLAITWTVNGTALTADRCQTEHLDSMTVQIVSDRDRQSAVEFLNVVCDLSRYSLTMVPSGPVSVYVDAVHVLRNQSECVRYSGIAHGTATDQFPQTPLAIDLKTVGSCP